MKLTGQFFTGGETLIIREFKILCGIFVLPVFDSLQEAEHGSVRSAPSERIVGLLGLVVSGILALNCGRLPVDRGVVLRLSLKLDV